MKRDEAADKVWLSATTACATTDGVEDSGTGSLRKRNAGERLTAFHKQCAFWYRL